MKRITIALLLLALSLAPLSFTACEGDGDLQAPLSFNVTSKVSTYVAGSTVTVTISVRNNTDRIEYYGDVESLFSSVATATHERGECQLTSAEHAPSDDTEKHYFEPGETVSMTYVFETETTSPSGAYTLAFTFNGEEKSITKTFTLYGGGNKTTADTEGTTEPSESTSTES